MEIHAQTQIRTRMLQNSSTRLKVIDLMRSKKAKSFEKKIGVLKSINSVSFGGGIQEFQF